MEDSKNNNKYAIIAAICIVLIPIWTLVYNIVVIGWRFYSYGLGLESAIEIVIAIALFSRKRIAVAVAFGLDILLQIYSVVHILSIYYGNFWILVIGDIWHFLADVAMITILILSLKNNYSARKIWFLGGVWCFIAELFYWISCAYLSLSNDYINGIIGSLLGIVGFFFVGVWIKGFEYSEKQPKIKKVKIKNSQKSNVRNRAAKNNTDALGNADKLELYYELLKSGAITQEEYEAKKKQLLGL